MPDRNSNRIARRRDAKKFNSTDGGVTRRMNDGDIRRSRRPTIDKADQLAIPAARYSIRSMRTVNNRTLYG